MRAAVALTRVRTFRNDAVPRPQDRQAGQPSQISTTDPHCFSGSVAGSMGRRRNLCINAGSDGGCRGDDDVAARDESVVAPALGHIDALTVEMLVQAALSTKESACSLDSWKPSAITAIARWFPGLLTDLAAIVNYIELHGTWPAPILLAYASLMEKDATLYDPKAIEFRPITVRSGVYRL